mgnify:CR=1 FL=1
MRLFDLSGRTALVTGSSRGLGFAIAEGLAEAGASLVLNGVDRARLATAVERLDAEGRAVRGAPFDVTDETAVEAAFAALDDDGVAVDIVVNNAGIQHRQPMTELSSADWHRVVEANLTSAFLVGRTAARRMIPRGYGKIVNIGSLTSQVARATIAPYTVAKGGVKLLTQAMAAEWAAAGIQANAIGPGFMETDMNEALVNDPEFSGWVRNRTPARRWGQPAELQGAAIFLASAASDFVNGQILYVDGGFLAVM